MLAKMYGPTIPEFMSPRGCCILLVKAVASAFTLLIAGHGVLLGELFQPGLQPAYSQYLYVSVNEQMALTSALACTWQTGISLQPILRQR